MKIEIIAAKQPEGVGRYVSPHKTQVLIDGQPVKGIRRLTLDMTAGELVTITIERYLMDGDRFCVKNPDTPDAEPAEEVLHLVGTFNLVDAEPR